MHTTTESAAQEARRRGVPLTEIHRERYGRGKRRRHPRVLPCAACGQAATIRASHSFCLPCQTAYYQARLRAGCAVRKAVAAGMLKPAHTSTCVDCAAPAAHYDHRDYSKPLQVDPVCRACNIRRGPARLA